jgi:hypothetical protein
MKNAPHRSQVVVGRLCLKDSFVRGTPCAALLAHHWVAEPLAQLRAVPRSQLRLSDTG